MRLKRTATTKERVKQILSKNEPSFSGLVPLEKIDMALALNWYAQYKEKKDSHRYLSDHCKRHNIKASDLQITAQVPTLGFVCRMVERGAILDSQSTKWLVSRLRALTEFIPKDALFAETKVTTVPPVKQTTIQDRLKEKSGKCIGDLEGAVDEFILSDFKKVPNTLEIMRTHDIKGAHGPNIVNFFKKWRDEFRVAIAGKDEQLNEAYSNYTITQLKKMEALYDQIISDALKVMGESLADRAPRIKKPRPPEKQVKKLKFCSEDTTLKIKSVPATRIVGASGLWVYQRNTRLLSYYAADDAQGLGVKGCKLLNYAPAKSWSKKLRKPEEVLPQVISGGKVYLKNLREQLTTKDGKVSGRINKECLLVRATV